MKIHLISYGDKKYDLRVEEFKTEAMATRFFDEIRVFRYEDIDLEFRNEFKEIFQSTRAGGFIWKPYFMKKTLKEMKYGDVLVYCDAGCCINGAGRGRFNHYLNFLSQSEKGIIAFQLPHKEYRYTKKEVFNQFDVAEDVIESGQLVATIILLKKCDHSMNMVDLWYNTVKENPDLFTDNMDNAIQHPEFVAHRHDQSIWSVLLKTHGAEIIPDETYFDDFEKQGAAFPLWAARIRPID